MSKECPACEGTGQCCNCGGMGICPSCQGKGVDGLGNECDECLGGKSCVFCDESVCDVCEGTGKVADDCVL